MSTVILACQTIKREVHLAINQTGVNYPVILIDSGLHNYPDRLRDTIQIQLNKIENVDTVLMAFGYCGNGLMGIKSPEARVIVPRADDCITLLLGSYDVRKKISKEAGTYFLTKGWLDYERNLITEYEQCVEKYGPDRALRVMKTMLSHYKRLMVIDTKAYPLEDILPTTAGFAEKMGMHHEKFTGSMRFLNKLLTGPWDEEFIILEPGQELTFNDVCLDNANGQSSPHQVLFGLNL